MTDDPFDFLNIHTPDSASLADAHEQWRKPPRQLVEQKPKGGTTLDYLGHAALTEILLRIDPTWSWRPLGTDVNGSPIVDTDENGKPAGLWIELRLLGHARLGYGSVDPSSRQSNGDRMKELIGDALRNAAMRYGIALDLWSKADLSATIASGGGPSTPVASSSPSDSAPVGGASSASPLAGGSAATTPDTGPMIAALKKLTADERKGLLENLKALGDDLGEKPSLKAVAVALISNMVDPADPLTSTAKLALDQAIRDEQQYDAMKADLGV